MSTDSTAPEAPAWRVTHNAAAMRFEATVEGQLCVCDYRRNGGQVALHHTLVPQNLGGRGIAAALVEAALAWARSESLTVQPLCSYVATYMRRHPATQDLLAPGFGGRHDNGPGT